MTLVPEGSSPGVVAQPPVTCSAASCWVRCMSLQTFVREETGAVAPAPLAPMAPASKNVVAHVATMSLQADIRNSLPAS